MQVAILLISNDYQWGEVLQQVLGPLAKVHIVANETEGLTEIRRRLQISPKYEIIIIDVGTVGGKSPALVNTIRKEQYEAKIVVVTAAPTWRQAKEFFRVGAIDYIRKSLDRKELLMTFQEVLKKKLPPWQPNDYLITGQSE